MPNERSLAWRKSGFSANDANCVELAWRKSSFSANDADCVELAWRKSSFSANDSDCVELARPGAETLIRDSKSPDTGTLIVPAAALAHLVAHTRHA